MSQNINPGSEPLSLTCYHGVLVVNTVTVQDVVGCPALNIKYNMEDLQCCIIVSLYRCITVPAVLHPAPYEEPVVDIEEDVAPAYARYEDQLAPGEGVVGDLSVSTEDRELK